MYFIFDKAQKKKIKKYLIKRKAEKKCDILNNEYNGLSHDSLYVIRYEVIHERD